MSIAERMILLLLVGVLLLSCGSEDGPSDAPRFSGVEIEEPVTTGFPSVIFVDATAAAGIDFRHATGAFGEKYLPETMGAGVVFFDFDGDHWPDLFFANGMNWPGREEGAGATQRLYHNERDGTFRDVTAAAGLDVTCYAMGAVAGDVDGDGDLDLYLTVAGPNRLFVNEEGTFIDRTAAAGVAGGTWTGNDGVEHPEWSSGAAFFDYDRDGDLDLYVANYVRWSIATDVFTTMDGRTKAYTTPGVYPGIRGRLFENDGNGVFADRSDRVDLPPGADPKALGVVVVDANRDGWPDLFISNDTQPNQLLVNLGGKRFRDEALRLGVAFDETGLARAGMGVAETEIGDGRSALSVGNFSREAISFFARHESGVYIDRAAPVGLSAPTLSRLTFGLVFFDVDLDGLEDLALANGHLEPTIAKVQREVRYAQPPQLFRRGVKDRFTDASESVGDAFRRPIVARGIAVADYDRDGDPDLCLTVNGGSPVLFRNENATGNAWLRLTLPGAVGARVTVLFGGREQVRTVRAGGSYLSQNEMTLTFGLGRAKAVEEVRVLWPDGSESGYRDFKAGAWYLVRKGVPATAISR